MIASLVVAVKATRMPLYWLSYRRGDAVLIILQPAHSAIAALLKAAMTGLDDVVFSESEGHLLPPDMAKKVPKTMIGRALSGKEAAALLEKTGETSNEENPGELNAAGASTLIALVGGLGDQRD